MLLPSLFLFCRGHNHRPAGFCCRDSSFADSPNFPENSGPTSIARPDGETADSLDRFPLQPFQSPALRSPLVRTSDLSPTLVKCVRTLWGDSDLGHREIGGPGHILSKITLRLVPPANGFCLIHHLIQPAPVEQRSSALQLFAARCVRLHIRDRSDPIPWTRQRRLISIDRLPSVVIADSPRTRPSHPHRESWPGPPVTKIVCRGLMARCTILFCAPLQRIRH